MKKPSSSIRNILVLCEGHDIEIVSYGLAPNPNGFCYEMGQNVPQWAVKRLNKWLDALNRDEVEELRKWVFG